MINPCFIISIELGFLLKDNISTLIQCESQDPLQFCGMKVEPMFGEVSIAMKGRTCSTTVCEWVGGVSHAQGFAAEHCFVTRMPITSHYGTVTHTQRQVRQKNKNTLNFVL